MKITITLLLQKTFAKTINIPIASLDKKWKQVYSIFTASKMSEEKRRLLLGVFSKLKQRVLWKWETESMPDKPDNVMLSKWLPQQDVLAHPKVRLFVSHGGQSSSQESLCHQKPMVCSFYWWLDLNPDPLVLIATALTTLPQPLPPETDGVLTGCEPRSSGVGSN